MKVWESIPSFINHAQLLRMKKIRGPDKIYMILILLNYLNLRKVIVYLYNASCMGGQSTQLPWHEDGI